MSSIDRLPIERRASHGLRALVSSCTVGELVKLAFTDPLSGCYNRAAFDVLHTHGDCRLIVDIDSLKWVNDNLGHASGDALIEGVARYLRLMHGEENVFRVGGDEFIITRPFEGTRKDMLKADKLRLFQFSSFFHEDVPVGRALSVGFGSGFDQADRDLNRAKRCRELNGSRASRGEQPPWIHGLRLALSL